MMISIPPLIVQRRALFLALLASVQLVMVVGPGTTIGRLLFLAHIGVGLLWQPFVQSHRRLGFGGVALVILVATLFASYLNWWLIVLWLMLLTGVVGGKVFLFPDRWERLFYLLALGYLATALMTVALPASVEPLVGSLIVPMKAGHLAFGVVLLMAFLPAEQAETGTRPEIIDYIYGVMVFQTMGLIVLGSLGFSLIFKIAYIESLMATLFLVSGTLLLLGFIWNPRAGFGGLGGAVAQHVLSIGMPFEEWLESLANLSQGEERPDDFLAQACALLTRHLHAVVGVRWQTASEQGSYGEQNGRLIRFDYGQTRLTLVCRVAPSPSLRWQYGLAIRLLMEIYADKQRAQTLKRLTFVEAVHETGARMTHDMKNLLQSLDALCAAAERPGSDASPRFNELLRRQLPEISSRLRQTLAKLNSPHVGEKPSPQAAVVWFENLRGRYNEAAVKFSIQGITAYHQVPDALLFSTVAENLLQNIAEKRKREAGLQAEIMLKLEADAPVLEVVDHGSEMPAHIANRLFLDRLPSDHGLGIGLYQCARLAEHHAYHLKLVENRAGAVRFRLAPA
ncbi:MAG: hypothetical protein Q8M20_12495 [Rhodocyclaceae bacterium]|nr:hypothetical protein [Rhodocyclaceae bacterium]MDZ4213821.1 hypothetical protein [Rhodocyclaceae bacterium]